MRGSQAVGRFQELHQQAAELREQWQALHVHLREVIERLGPVEAQARRDLAAAYLPRLDQASLAALRELTGFTALARRDPLSAMAREEEVLRKTVARIEADARWQRREYLVGTHGELTRKLAETRDMAEPWEAAARRFEDQEGFQELIDLGYDTPSFSLSFWQPEYWRCWARGDRICEALGLADFGDDVLPAWRDAVAKREPWRAEVGRVEAAIAEVHELARQRDEALERVPRLPEIYLEGSVELVAGFLETADCALLDEWARAQRPDDRAIRMGLRRLAGIRAKREMLQELLDEGVLPAVRSMEERARKYRAKATKYARAKHAGTPVLERELDPGFSAKAPQLLERRDKLRRMVDQVERYDGYDRFDLANPPQVWFAEITGKRPPSQMPRLAAWYATWDGNLLRDEPEEAAHRAVGAALGASDLDRGGYLS